MECVMGKWDEGPKMGEGLTEAWNILHQLLPGLNMQLWELLLLACRHPEASSQAGFETKNW